MKNKKGKTIAVENSQQITIDIMNCQKVTINITYSKKGVDANAVECTEYKVLPPRKR